MAVKRSGCGQSGKVSAKNDAATAPMEIWPSAPIFQKRILNASVTPSDVMSSGIAILMVSRRFPAEPTAPPTIVPYTGKGLKPTASRKRPPVASARTMASTRYSAARQGSMDTR